MNKTVFVLAFKDLLMHKRRTVIQILIVVIVSGLYFTYLLGSEHYRELYQLYCEARYGRWYAYAEIPQEQLYYYQAAIAYNTEIYNSEDEPGDDLKQDPDRLHAGYLYLQGTYDDYVIGHADEELFELCRLNITEGTVPGDGEVCVTESFADNCHMSVGDSLLLEVCGRNDTYVISGIINKSQKMFPDIYTSIQEGNTCYYFFDRSVGLKVNEGIYQILTSDVYLNYQYNQWGYNHCTIVNEGSNYMYNNAPEAENRNVNDQTVTATYAIVLVIIIMYLMYSSSLKKRIREFALLRGIGMTAGQLFLMSFVQTLFVCAIAIAGGLLIGLLLTSLLELWLKIRWDVFTYYSVNYYLQHISEAGKLFLQLLAITMSGIVLPLLMASQTSLTGSFEAHKHPILTFHRKKLKTQSKIRIAWQYLISHHTLTAGFLAFMSALCIYILPEYYGKDIEINSEETGAGHTSFGQDQYIVLTGNAVSVHADDLPVIKDVTYQRKFRDYYSLGMLSCGDLKVKATDFGLLTEEAMNENIEGRLPENDHEILASANVSVGDFTFSSEQIIVNGEESTAYFEDYTEELRAVKIGDIVTIDDENYTVTGLILPLEQTGGIPSFDNYSGEMTDSMLDSSFEYFYMPQCDFYVMPYLFNRIDGIKESFRYLYYDDSAVKDKLVNELCHRGAGFNEIKSSDISFYSQGASQGAAASISYEVMIIPMIIALALLCMVNDSQIHSETKDYIIERTIGMTKGDIIGIQIQKALLLSFGVIMAILGYGLYIFWKKHLWIVPLSSLAVFSLSSLVFYVLVFVIPILGILPLNIEHLNTE